jgi:hypothetical protein
MAGDAPSSETTTVFVPKPAGPPRPRISPIGPMQAPALHPPGQTTSVAAKEHAPAAQLAVPKVRRVLELMQVLAGGVHTRSPVQVPTGSQSHVAEQPRLCVPHRPHASVDVAPGMHSPSPVQSPSTQRRALLQVRTRVPHMPHATLIVCPGVHSSSSQVPGMYVHAAPQVSARDWPLGHPSSVLDIAPGVHSPSPVHAVLVSHSHAVLQRAIRVPQSPHATGSVVPGAQIPSSSQGPYDQVRPDEQKRVLVPHMPHATVSIAPAVGHASSWHAPAGAKVHASSHETSRV